MLFPVLTVLAHVMDFGVWFDENACSQLLVDEGVKSPFAYVSESTVQGVLIDSCDVCLLVICQSCAI